MTVIEELMQSVPALRGDRREDSERESIKSLLQVALDSPINYPKLTDSIFPGDRVAILVQNQLPAAKETLESLMNVLESSRIETENILIVVPQGMSGALGLIANAKPDERETTVPQTFRMRDDQREIPLTFEIHDGENENAASYLAANKQGNPVYVNRSLCDCDVILPLSCIAPNERSTDCLYPEFSTDETKDRFRKKVDSKSERVEEANLANDSLGLFFSIELVCRPGEVIDRIVCGERSQARRAAAELLDPLWQIDAPDDCDAVVTTIESSADSATWKDVIRAVNSAATLSEDGPIVVWTELSQKPSEKVKTACSAQFEGSVPDSLSTKMQHFASILCERPVYLRSRLSQNLVEGLGLGHIEAVESVERVIRPYSNPLLIRDGHLRIVADAEATV